MAASRIGFFTDVEGNWEFFLRCVDESDVMTWDGKALDLKEGCKLVFGGDGGDKRDGTLRFYRAVVDLKKKYPDRVFLIVGNRDANKLRLPSELHSSDLLPSVPLPKGITGQVKQFAEYLAEIVVQEKKKKIAENGNSGAEGEGEALGASEEEIARVCTPANKLRWTLDCTMGAQGDFEFRRKELAILRGGVDVSLISDDDVVASYLESVREGGVILDYLRLGHLAVRIDNSLFVHGGIAGIFKPSEPKTLESCLGYIPGHPPPPADVSQIDVDLWIAQLNAWYRSQVEEAISNPIFSENRTQRGGSDLITYSAYCEEPSVIMAKSLNSLSQPVPLVPAVQKSLSALGVRFVVCGHTPHGTCPSLVRGAGVRGGVEGEGVDVLLCDTSYSAFKVAEDNRGIAACGVELHGKHCHVRGILPDGKRYLYTLGNDGDDFIGRGPADDYWVKAKYVAEEGEKEAKYLLCKVSGWKYEYKDATEEEVKKIVEAAAAAAV